MTKEDKKRVLHNMRVDRQVEIIMREFNFARVREVMQRLEWRWGCNNLDSPSIEELRKEAEHQLREVFECPPGSFISSGGFMALKRQNTLWLGFVVEDTTDIY